MANNGLSHTIIAALPAPDQPSRGPRIDMHGKAAWLV